MGARPSSFFKGGGMFNGEGKITGYEFFVGDTTKVKNGPRKGEDFTPLSLNVSFRMDGADQDVSKRLLIGDADTYGDVTDGNQVLQTPDGQNISAKSEAGIFIATLCDNGFDETRFSDTNESIDYRPMIGTRIVLVNEVNEEKTKRQGKEKNKTTGKEYDRRDLKVARVLALPTATPASGRAMARTTSASTSNSRANGSGKADTALETLASETLVNILADTKEGTLPKSKLRMKVIAALGPKHPQRADVEKLLHNDAFLAAVEGVAYDPADKAQTIALA